MLSSPGASRCVRPPPRLGAACYWPGCSCGTRLSHAMLRSADLQLTRRACTCRCRFTREVSPNHRPFLAVTALSGSAGSGGCAHACCSLAAGQSRSICFVDPSVTVPLLRPLVSSCGSQGGHAGFFAAAAQLTIPSWFGDDDPLPAEPSQGCCCRGGGSSEARRRLEAGLAQLALHERWQHKRAFQTLELVC